VASVGHGIKGSFIVLAETGSHSSDSTIAVLCRREGIAESLYYSWSKEFLEAGKRRLSGDTARQATARQSRAKASTHLHPNTASEPSSFPPETQK
jgi:transposase-like protein